jgi:long-chain-fatty-acid--CoA ligase ACSBG
MFNLANTLILSKIKQALGLDCCLAFFFGAAPMKQATIDYFSSLDIPLFNCYGLSETTGGTTMHTIDGFRLDTAGLPIDGTEMKIDKPD